MRIFSWRRSVQQRYLFGFMGFTTMLVAYGMRISLSIAITVMAKRPESGGNVEGPCTPEDLPKNTSTSSWTSDPADPTVYEWDEHLQGIILSSFYWGYVITQLPGGMIAERFGGKHTVGLGILLTTILTLFLPFSIYTCGPAGLITIRVIMGLCEGVTLPGLTALMSHWVPLEERSKIGAFVHGGAPIGIVFTTSLSGLILKHYHWSVVFYLFGALGVVLYAAWMVLVYSTPDEHPLISEVEKTYLKQALSKDVQEDPPPVPWRYMLTSMPLWALVAVQVGHDWGFYTVATDLPKYMDSVLHLSVDQNGYLSSLPYIGMWLSSSVTSWLMDYLVAMKYLSNTKVRKLGSMVASIGPGVFLLGAVYAGCEKALVVVMFVIGVTLLGSGIPSLKINALDLSPNHAGTVMAFANGISSCSGIVTPYLVGLLAPNQTIGEWKTVFFIVFCVLLKTNIVYLCFGSGEVQRWNNPEFLEKVNEVEKESIKDSTASQVQLQTSLGMGYLHPGYTSGTTKPKRVNFSLETKA